MAFSGSQITRLGNIAIPRSLTGSFSGKTESVVVDTHTTQPIDVSISAPYLFDLDGPTAFTIDGPTRFEKG